ncbi:MAG: hypothetical protein ABI315_06865 [Bacteroidia bacterium]
MKWYKIIYFSGLFLIFYPSAFAQSNDTVCLEITGIVEHEGMLIDGVKIKLYKENEEMEMTEITSTPYHDHTFKFKLLKNAYYAIEVSKEGYIARMISISTQLPANVNVKPIFKYEFHLEMFKNKDGLDDYYLDFPVALIDYDANKDLFMSHEKYTRFIKGKINESVKKSSKD